METRVLIWKKIQSIDWSIVMGYHYDNNSTV